VKARILILMALLGVIAAVAVAMTATVFVSVASAKSATAKESQARSAMISELINTYERQRPFKGVADGNLPKTLSQGLHLGVITVSFNGGKTGINHNGYVDYGRANGADVIGASDGRNNDRFALVLQNAKAPTRYALMTTLPAHATVVNHPSGSITVNSPTGGTTLAPALAVDARGHLIPARYRITNGKLVITVQNKNATYPVMIDPVSSSYWWGTQTWYSRGDVRNYASWYGAVGVAAAACNEMGPLAGLCRAVVGRYAGWISGTWMYAKNTNQCLTMRMTWTGQVIGVDAYGCNWG
jgi:hypothetical protein